MKLGLWTVLRAGMGGAALFLAVGWSGIGTLHAQETDGELGLQKDVEYLNSVLSSYIRSHVYDDYSFGGTISDVDVEDLILGLHDAVDWTMEYLGEVRLLERIERQNAINVLEGFARGNGLQLAEQYGTDEGFQETVRYLVGEGLLGTMGTSIESAQLTLTGCRIIRRYSDSSPYPGCDRFSAEESQPTPEPIYYAISAPVGGGQIVDFTNQELALRNAALPDGMMVVDPASIAEDALIWVETVGGEQQAIRLDIAASAEPRTYYLRTSADSGLDPVLSIYWGDPAYVAGDIIVPGDDRYLYYDDDGLPNFNSEVVFNHHEAATYWIVLSEFSGLSGNIEMTLSEVSFAMTPVETEVQQAHDFSDAILEMIAAAGDFRVETDAIIQSEGQVVQFTLPDLGGARTVYAWTESVGIDPVAELFEAAFIANETMMALLRPGEIIASGDDGPPPLDLNPVVEFQHSGAATYWLNLREYWGESGQVTVVISDVPPW